MQDEFWPLKPQSLPRLKLCATFLMANVLQVVLKDIHIPIQMTCSTIVLA